MAQILTEEVNEEPAADAEEDEPWELDDVMPDGLSSSILYEDVFPSVDLRYDTFSYNVKESIILKQPMDLDEYTYSFLLTLDGLEPELQEDGSILLLDDAYEAQYTIPAPYMWDAENVYSDAVVYELEETNDGWILTVCADENWLEAEDRVYPVTIDPSVKIENDEMLFTTAVEKGSPSSTSTYARPGHTSVGTYSSFGSMEGYIKIQNLPELPAGSIVTEAKLSPGAFKKYYIVKDFRVDISALTEPLSADEWSGLVNWNAKPNKEPVPMDFAMVALGVTDFLIPKSWDITPAVMNWYHDPSSNYGLSLTAVDSSSNPSSCVRINSDNVKLSIIYRNAVGTESYYTYETQSASRAGTGYVGDYTSTLTVFKSDLSYSSTTIPFSVGHVYNSTLGGKELFEFDETKDTFAPDYSVMKMGHGWQLSVQESVRQTTIDGKRYLVYRDGDGTLHYFKNTDGNTYVDEDGLGLKITQTTSGSDVGYMMEDQSENQRYFRNGYLKYIKDTNGNKICFLYGTDTYSDDHSTWHPEETDYLTKIVAVNTDQKAQDICILSYNSSNQLSQITDFAGRTTQFTYTNGNLTKITHPDGTAAHYAYDANGQLIRMYDDEADYGIEYEYDSDGVCAIHEYTAATIDGVQNEGVHVQRKKESAQEVRYRYDGDDRKFNSPEYLSTDDIVNCYYFDYTGRTINAVTLNYDGTTILGVTAAAYTDTEDASNNKIEKTAQSGQNGVNMLSAGGVETHNGYTPSSSDWVKIDTDGNFNAVIKTTEVARTGVGSLKTWMGYSATSNAENGNKRIAIYQTADLVAGKTYTVSAYVNTQGIQQFDTNGGAYVAIMNSSNEVLSVGNKVSYKTSSQIENGWLRVYATFECEVAGNYRIAAVQDNAYGHSYFDDLQLEEGDVPSNVNLLQNGSFAENTSEWTTNNFTRTAGEDLHLGVLSITGDPEEYLRASQRIIIDKVCTDQTFLLSGWGKAASAADCETAFPWNLGEDIDEDHDSRYFGLIARAWYTDADDVTKPHAEYFFMPFNDDYDDWQFASCVIVPHGDHQEKGRILQYIDVYVVYDKNFSTMSVDNISLRQEPCTTYTYNTEGNVIAVNATGTASQSVDYKSDNVRPETVRVSEGEAYIYQYNSTNKYLPEYISNFATGVYTYYGYDKFGNNTETHIGDLNGNVPSSYPKIKSYAEYSEDGSQLMSETNGNGQTTTYLYNNRRNLLQTTDSNGTNVVTHEIAANDRPYSSYISGVVSVHNTYSNGLLSRITRGGYITGNATKQNQYYNMSYDSFGNMTEVSIGEDVENARVLASYSYGTNNNHLDSMTYGNGDSIAYTYDDLDRMAEETWDDGTSYRYLYNAEGALAKKVDSTDQTKVDNGTADAVNYEYDSLGRLIRSSLTDANGISMLTEHLYDRQNRIEKQSWQFRNDNTTMTTYTEEYTYRNTDGMIKEMAPAIGNAVSFAYDDIERLSSRTNDVYKRSYSYRNIDSNRTTTQIENIIYAADGTAFVPFTLSYIYDAVGNISEISCAQLPAQNTSYEYDVQGQMTSETINGIEYKYTYDTYGNIRKVSKVVDGVETQLHTYTYGDSDWLDLLTSFDGQSITYDEIGNPTSYYNGTRWAFDWERGRQLVAAESNNYDIEYTYDMAGIRDSKKVDDVTYEYMTLSGKVMRQTWKDEDDNEHVIDFAYDNTGSPYAFTYGGTTYYYVLNQQGDVIRIVDADGETQAQYQYNAWGKVLGKSGALADINPIRYRGYYYDTETGFYYLQSRYYDPGTGRFINADDVAFTGADGSYLSYNLFAYCMNNPVNRFDANGNWSLPNWAKVTIGAVAIAGLAVATVCSGGAAAVVCGAALSGAIAGGTSGAVIGAIGGGISGGWQGALDGACSGFMSGTLIGGVTGAASAGLNIATGVTSVSGNAHGSTLHKLATNMEAGKMAASGRYSQIGLNKALKTMGLNGTKRPDVIGIAKNGIHKIVEVVSPRQSTKYIVNKMSIMLSDNPGSVGKIVTWVRGLFK